MKLFKKLAAAVLVAALALMMVGCGGFKTDLAQQVKNAVIVPVGAKGGFVPRRTVLLVSGHDEEVGGSGAVAVAAWWTTPSARRLPTTSSRAPRCTSSIPRRTVGGWLTREHLST